MRRAAALLAMLAVLVAACGGGDGWTKTAGQTTCADWLDRMTKDDRQGLASAMLKILWEKDGAAEDPPQAVVLRFANAIGGTCTAYRTESVSSVGSGLYTLSSDVKPGSQ